ncbi:DUF2092 domain-containing protein [Pontixanthobacter gangjinensis]|uniref:DUF2092 domain-containing protein n=1 Tax=Christiangramia aestuarii TaxID=1028746 RepID=A0A7K1LPA4_9FLAO|nr:DUF2092 domain-containing protein [Christiangramia aestuarii]MUP42639.1 DUF2092 domain-containing protein [Christiangramia aestuarii]
MKKSFLLLFLFCSIYLNAQETASLDTTAVRILDRMADLIGGLRSVSFTANISQDVAKSKLGLVREYSENEVYMVGPDKMHVQVNGSAGHKGYWYNGATLVYYSFDENNYSVIDAPSDIITMMDSIYRNFDIEFPAADIFFPGFVDILLEDFPHIEYLGEKEVDGINCFHIMAVNENTNLQLWVANNAFFLPERFLIIHKDDLNKQYEVNFKNWEINPDLPEEMFSFEPPPKAKNIAIMATKSF